MVLFLICSGLFLFHLVLYRFLVSRLTWTTFPPDLLIYFFSGWILFMVLRLLGGETLLFFYIFEHEFSHVLASLLMFKPVVGLNVNIFRGGHVKIRGESIFIALAPYIFPLFATLIFGLRWIVQNRFLPALTVLFGFAVLFYLFRLRTDIHLNQTDFRYAGRFLSVMIIVITNGLFLPLLILTFFGRFDLFRLGVQFVWIHIQASILSFFS